MNFPHELRTTMCVTNIFGFPARAFDNYLNLSQWKQKRVSLHRVSLHRVSLQRVSLRLIER